MHYERLNGITPDEFHPLDTHPDGNYAVLQVGNGTEDAPHRAAVYDRRTRRQVHPRQDVLAACWRKKGTELLTVAEIEEDNHEFRRYAWPSHELIGSVELPILRGTANLIAAAAEGCFAAVRWYGEDHAGWEIVDVDGGTHRRDATYFNYWELAGPVFSPDGRRVAAVITKRAPSWLTTAQGTEAILGTLVVALCETFDYLEQEIRSMSFDLDAFRSSEPVELPGPVFLDNARLKLTLPMEEEVVVDVHSPSGSSFRTRIRRAREAEEEELRARRLRLEAIAEYNLRAREVAQTAGSRCPGCKQVTLTFYAGTPEERALFHCSSCKRSFGLDEVTPGSPGAERLRM